MNSPNEGNIEKESKQRNEDGKGLPDITTAKFKVSQVKRQDAQKKAFTRWINSKIQKEDGSVFIKDIFADLRDGNNLITLLENLTGRKLNRVSGKLRLHKLNNVQVALDFLTEYKIKLVNIGNTDVVDGIHIPTLGLIWSIIYKFQIQGALVDVFQISKEASSPVNEKDVEKAILDWCCEAVKDYEGVDVKNFSTSWRDGLAFNALIHRYRPNLFMYQNLLSKPPKENLEHAFGLAESAFGVHKLLEPSDFQREMIDSRLVVLYVSTLYEKLKDLEPVKNDTITSEETEEIRSYIRAEMDFLNECDEFIATAKELGHCSIQDLAEEYQKLMNFIEELQPHQLKVGELVNQTETLILSGLIVEDEIESLQNGLESLKKLWQTIFDRTSLRQERLRELLLDTIKGPIVVADDELKECKERLENFSYDPFELHPALQQCQEFQDYVDELRQLEGKIEAIRTGEEAGDALEVLSEEDELIVSNFIQQMIDSFVELGKDVAETKVRITDNLYQLVVEKIKEIEKVLHSTEKVTAKDMNNNPLDKNLKRKLVAYKALLSQLNKMEPEVEDLSKVCSSINEGICVDQDEADDLKKRLASLNESWRIQTEALQTLVKQ